MHGGRSLRRMQRMLKTTMLLPQVLLQQLQAWGQQLQAWARQHVAASRAQQPRREIAGRRRESWRSWRATFAA